MLIMRKHTYSLFRSLSNLDAEKMPEPYTFLERSYIGMKKPTRQRLSRGVFVAKLLDF